MYAKLFTSIYQGTLRGNSHGLLVFTNMLAHCDKEGHCDMHPKAIAEEVGLTIEQVKAAIEELESPDEESRSPEENGRRIIRLDEHRAWGWVVVNYIKYRSIRDEEDRREQNRKAQEAWRLRNQSKPKSASVSQRKPQSAHTEAEAYTKAYTEAKDILPAASGVATQPPTPTALPARQRKSAAKPASESKSADTWAAYSQAYRERYSVDPVRNAKTNAQMANLIARLGADEAPGVARFYLSNRNSLYAASKHCTDLLLRDAEKLRTEWATGEVTHQRDAREDDRMSATAGMVKRITEKLEARGVKL